MSTPTFSPGLSLLFKLNNLPNDDLIVIDRFELEANNAIIAEDKHHGM